MSRSALRPSWPLRTAARRVLSLVFFTTQCDATIDQTAGSTAGPAGGRGAPSARADGEWAAGCCPILGAKWERRFTVRWGQTRSDGVSVAISTRLTRGNVLDQGSC